MQKDLESSSEDLIAKWTILIHPPFLRGESTSHFCTKTVGGGGAGGDGAVKGSDSLRKPVDLF